MPNGLSTICCFLAQCFLCFFLGNYAFAEESKPAGGVPSAVESNVKRFGVSAATRHADAKAVVDAVKKDQGIGKSIAQKFGLKGSEFGSPIKGQKAFKQHPFKYGSPWEATWYLDGLTLQGGVVPFGMDVVVPSFLGVPGSCAEWTYLKQEAAKCTIDVNRYIMANYPGYILATCDTGRPDIPIPGAQMWEYWRAENQYEANNFGVSEVMDLAGRHLVMAQLKDANLLLGAGAQSGKPPLGGLVLRGGDRRPAGLRAPPHIGNSHFEGSGALPFEGQYNQFETRVVRTAHDAQRSVDYENGKDPFAYLRECMPPRKDKDIENFMFKKKKRFAFFNSERIPDLWRLPELSMLRSQEAGPYQQLYGKLHQLSMLVGQAYHGGTMSPQTKLMPAIAGPKGNAMSMSSLCASYWLRDRIRYATLYYLFGDVDFPLDRTFNGKILPVIQNKEDWKRLCYHPSLGSLYPLVGSVPTDSNVLAPIMAIRRFMDWTSWSGVDRIAAEEDGGQGGGLDDIDRKTNFMDGSLDAVSESIYKDYADAPHVGGRRQDKIQRLWPAPTPNMCVGMRWVHPRNPLFAQSIMPAGFSGSWRYAHWNRRKACICSSGWMWNEYLVRLDPIPAPICIPEEE